MKEKLSTLWAYINSQEEIIGTLFQKIRDMKPLNEDKMVHSAYLLHNLYSAYEDMFTEISRTFENNIDWNFGFHKNLLRRMNMAIPGIRPEVLSFDSYQVLSELMGFRHVFRHAYNFTLSADRMEVIRKKILDNQETVERDLKEFKRFLEESFSS